MRKRNTHNPSIPNSIFAFLLMVCFVAFQGSVTYAPLFQTAGATSQLDLDLEKDAKEEIDKENIELLCEDVEESISLANRSKRHTTHIYTFYQKPHLQVYSPPPEQV